jgi:hypothetical protein
VTLQRVRVGLYMQVDGSVSFFRRGVVRWLCGDGWASAGARQMDLHMGWYSVQYNMGHGRLGVGRHGHGTLACSDPTGVLCLLPKVPHRNRTRLAPVCPVASIQPSTQSRLQPKHPWSCRPKLNTLHKTPAFYYQYSSLYDHVG